MFTMFGERASGLWQAVEGDRAVPEKQAVDTGGGNATEAYDMIRSHREHTTIPDVMQEAVSTSIARSISCIRHVRLSELLSYIPSVLLPPDPLGVSFFPCRPCLALVPL